MQARIIGISEMSSGRTISAKGFSDYPAPTSFIAVGLT